MVDDKYTKIFCETYKRVQKMTRQLVVAQEQLSVVMPLDVKIFAPDSLRPGELLFLDGFRQRFSDLQDLLGKSMFKAITLMDQDEAPGNELSTRERLVLMEKRGLIDRKKWQRIREIRNAFAHDYPDQHEEKARSYNAAWECSRYLIEIVDNIGRYIAKHYGSGLCD